MQHRHIDTQEWTVTAIDSLLERGDLKDWRELFGAARRDAAIARRVLETARFRRVPGSSAVAEFLVIRLWPEMAPDHVSRSTGGREDRA